MKIDPPKRHFKKQVGLVVVEEDGEPYVYGEWGNGPVDRIPDYGILYAFDGGDIHRVIRGGRGRARMWRHSAVSFELDGAKIRGTRGVFHNLPVATAFDELVRWADWVRAFGGNPGSIGGTATSIHRASLEHPILIREPDFEVDRIPLGGRVERMVDRGRYDFISSWDISGAYSYALGSLDFARRYIECENATTNDDGYADASVEIPKGIPWGPLPIHERGRVVYPVEGRIDGIWTIAELRMAEHAGAHIRINRAWISRGRVGLFNSRFTKAVAIGRGLGGPAGKLAKATINSLWGSFVIRGSGEWWSYPNGRLHREFDKRQAIPRSPATAGLIVSSVRERLFREALCANVFILGCHTDGVLIETGCHLRPEGEGLGDWRIKNAAVYVDYLSPQIYRMMTGEGWKYTVAGLHDAKAAEEFFRRKVANDKRLRLTEVRERVQRARIRKQNRSVEWAGMVG